MIVTSVCYGADNEYSAPHVKLRGSPLEVESGDYIAAISVYSTAPAEHGGYPATRINLGTGDSTRSGNVGRLVLRNDQYEESGILEWVRTFDTDEKLSEFTSYIVKVVPTGFKTIEARQLGYDDKLVVTDEVEAATLSGLRNSYLVNLKTETVIEVKMEASNGSVKTAIGLWGRERFLMLDPSATVYIVAD